MSKKEEKLKLKLVYGEFVNVESVKSLKELIAAIAEPFAVKTFDSLYVSYPHMEYTNPYHEPERRKDSQLELYLFGVPTDVEQTKSRVTTLTLNAEPIALAGEQQICLQPTAVPPSFTPFKDDNGQIYALRRDNQIWVLLDLGHNIVGGASDVPLTAVLQAVLGELIAPLSQEDKNRIIDAKLAKTVAGNIEKGYESLKASMTTKQKNFEEYEKAFQTAYKEYIRAKKIIESIVLPNEAECLQVLTKLRSLAFVQSLGLGKHSFLQVSTKEILLGPLNYGKWNIEFGESFPWFYPQNYARESAHPNDHLEDGNFCMGGFAKSYIDATQEGDLEKAMVIARYEITNYIPSQCLRPVEPFLAHIMGAKPFEEALQELASKAKPSIDSKKYKVQISSVFGTEITLVGSRLSRDSSDPETTRGVVKVS